MGGAIQYAILPISKNALGIYAHASFHCLNLVCCISTQNDDTIINDTELVFW